MILLSSWEGDKKEQAKQDVIKKSPSDNWPINFIVSWSSDPSQLYQKKGPLKSEFQLRGTSVTATSQVNMSLLCHNIE